MANETEEFRELKKQSRIKHSKRVKNRVNGIDINPYGVTFFNVWVKFPKKMLMIFISAILYNIGVATFLAKAATVATGISALVQSITYTVSATAPYFAYIYFLFNLPFIIIFWKKNSRLFMVLTTYWLLWQVVFQSFLLIPAVQSLFDNVSILYVNWHSPMKDGKEITNSFKALIPWDVYGNYQSHYAPVWDYIKAHNGVAYTPAEATIGGIAYTAAQMSQFLRFYIILEAGYNNPTWPIIVYTIIGGVCAGSAGGLSWKNSASTAGSDFVVYYVSRIKQKSVGRISTIVALCFAAFSIILISSLELAGVIDKTSNKPLNHAALLLRAVCTIGYVFLYNAFIEVIYPKYRKIKIEIYTKEPDKIIKHFKEINYWHGYNIDNMLAGYTNTQTVRIETFALYLEQNLIRNEVLLADPNAWITVTKVHQVFGKFDTSKIE
ncbi:YitT family protein [Metamycoplasma neophronis]|uniref:YitT family protein n=1 Tax=Metamycoplasma neophronis TaxID=872983 RepID=A0ABY2Z155_9BACT|nr:YitT family protein [Metamycoplasma neophronis]TPR54273.1 YitT family protein [Metamycoplasma neophronis]